MITDLGIHENWDLGIHENWDLLNIKLSNSRRISFNNISDMHQTVVTFRDAQ